MSKEKRGGARLEKPATPKKTAPERSPDPSKPENVTGKKGLSKGAKIAIIVVAVIAALFLGLFALYKSWAVLPDLEDLPTPSSPVISDGGSGLKPIVSDRKENFYTFLVVGRDTGGGGNTDTIMLAAYPTRSSL